MINVVDLISRHAVGRPPSASVGDDVDGGHACLGGIVCNVFP